MAIILFVYSKRLSIRSVFIKLVKTNICNVLPWPRNYLCNLDSYFNRSKTSWTCGSAERLNTVTMIAASNADGGFISPLLLLPWIISKDFMIHRPLDGSIGATNSSGWSNETTFQMFINHFINFVRPTKKQPVLVLLDNHGSHISVPAIRLAKENSIIMLTLHPHTTNKM